MPLLSQLCLLLLLLGVGSLELWQPEYARLVIARLRLGRNGACSSSAAAPHSMMQQHAEGK
jgi:hypothetical protein